MFLLAAMAGLGVVGTLVNAGAGVFVVYAAALAGRLSPVRRAVVAVAVLAGLAGVMFLISTVPLPWRLLAVGPIIVFVLVIGAAGIIDGERERMQARLRRADEEIERLATIAERERIARDLHDLLGHTLSVVVLKSELAGRLVRSDPDRVPSRRCARWTHRADRLAEVRCSPWPGAEPGLGVELVNARRALSAAGVDLQATIDLPVLPAEHEAALALALREAVTNVVRRRRPPHHHPRRGHPRRGDRRSRDDGRAPRGRTVPAWPACANASPPGGHVTRRTGPSGASDPAQS